MIKIDLFNTDVTKTTYKSANGRSIRTYSELYMDLIQQAGLNVATITPEDSELIKAQIAQAHSDHLNGLNEENINEIRKAIEPFIPAHITQINDYILEGFAKYLAWCTESNGNVIFLARTPSKGTTWRIIEDVHPYIRSHIIDDAYIIEHLSKFYYTSVFHGGPVLYRVVDINTGRWSKAMPKYDLWRIGALKAFEKHVITQDQGKLILDIISRETMSPQSLDPFDTVFGDSVNAWLWNSWKKEPKATMQFPKTMTNDPSVSAFSYVNLNDISKGETPDFDGWLEMMPEHCRGPFMATLFTAVKEGAHTSLLTWLYGEGNDGKSTLFKSMMKSFGSSMVCPIGAKDLSGEFGMEALIGKRIIFVGDLQSGNFLHSNLVHAVTGGDPLLINRKNQKHITVDLDSVLYVGANTPPEVNMANRNEARRIFFIPLSEPSQKTMQKYCEFDKKTGEILRRSNGMPVFTGYNLCDKLVQEMPHILYKCYEAWKQYYKNGVIVLPTEVFDDMMDRLGSNEVDIFDRFATKFLTKSSKNTNIIDINNAYLSFTHGENAMNNTTAYNYELRDLKRYIKTTFGLEPAKLSVDGMRIRAYRGLVLKNVDLIKSSKSILTNNESSIGNPISDLIDSDILEGL